MNFEKLYNNMLSETNVAGGAASAFGPNGGGNIRCEEKEKKENQKASQNERNR
jgi:hypothetical protein